jgi:hypothetical protein
VFFAGTISYDHAFVLEKKPYPTREKIAPRSERNKTDMFVGLDKDKMEEGRNKGERGETKEPKDRQHSYVVRHMHVK